MLDWRKWMYSLVSAAIGGGANAISAALVAPETFNFNTGLPKLEQMAFAGALIAVAMFLKQSPLPPVEPLMNVPGLPKGPMNPENK